MDAASLLPDLIRAARAGPDAVVARVREALPGFSERRSIAAPRAHLFTRGGAAPRLVLSGHVDVVPVGEGWAPRDPFGGEVADGRVWGRGACDMLGSVACFVEAALSTSAPVGILLTTDEETGMKGAEAALAERFLPPLEAVVVGEPTSMAVGIAEKGVLWLRIDCAGTNAHGSMPELGDNAVMRAVRVASRLAGTRPPGEHALLGRGTLSVNRIAGGEAVNQVPAASHLEVDVRYLPGTGEADALALVRGALEAKCALSVISSHAPFEVAADSPLARAALAAVARAGREPRALGLPYGTEASKFAPAGLPCVILGPGESALAHTNRESIALADLRAGALAYAALVEAYA